jgi:hypothetical protein
MRHRRDGRHRGCSDPQISVGLSAKPTSGNADYTHLRADMSPQRAVFSGNPQSWTIVFMPKRSAASLQVTRCEVIETLSFCHAFSPSSRTRTFEMPLFCKPTATCALVDSPDQEQYRTMPRCSGTTTFDRLWSRAGSIRTAPGMPTLFSSSSSKLNRSTITICSVDMIS